MNLQENIRRILREETEFTSKFRRRLNGFVEYIWNNYATQYPCEVETFEGFMTVLYAEIEMVIDEGDGEEYSKEGFLDITKSLQESIIRILREETKHKTSELTERCWKGYTQKGMKTMFGKKYPNCVKIKKK